MQKKNSAFEPDLLLCSCFTRGCNAPRRTAANYKKALRRVSSACPKSGRRGLARKPPAISPDFSSVFRYLFDSSKARQTVRWRRFRGSEFALENRAKRVRERTASRLLPARRRKKSWGRAGGALPAVGAVAGRSSGQRDGSALNRRCHTRTSHFRDDGIAGNGNAFHIFPGNAGCARNTGLRVIGWPSAFIGVKFRYRPFLPTGQAQGFCHLGAGCIILRGGNANDCQYANNGHHNHQFNQGKTFLHFLHYTFKMRSKTGAPVSFVKPQFSCHRVM